MEYPVMSNTLAVLNLASVVFIYFIASQKSIGYQLAFLTNLFYPVDNIWVVGRPNFNWKNIFPQSNVTIQVCLIPTIIQLANNQYMLSRTTKNSSLQWLGLADWSVVVAWQFVKQVGEQLFAQSWLEGQRQQWSVMQSMDLHWSATGSVTRSPGCMSVEPEGARVDSKHELVKIKPKI